MSQQNTDYDTPGSYSLTLSSGKYKFECWGASGGIGSSSSSFKYHGGYGAYVSGEILLKKRTTFYLFVGGRGSNAATTTNTIAAGGYNGGGNGGADTQDDDNAAGGGGATDIRLVNGAFDNIVSLRSRIIVAAGGSGSAYNCYGAPGGNLNGFKVTAANAESYSQSEVTQTYGYSLGRGENGRAHTNVASSGGGGGYYGGFAYYGGETPYNARIASSGNSFISGHPNCNALNENGTHTGNSIHYSQLYFENTVMLTGFETFKSPQNVTEVGHSGNGFIRVTTIMTMIEHNIKCTNSYAIFNIVYSLIVLLTSL
jgi:hypothetical protein